MKPIPKATHSQTSAGPGSVPAPVEPQRQPGQRHEHREHRDAAPRQVAAVAGADQHAVEDEDHPGHRLEDGGRQQHRPQQVADLRVGGEQATEQRGGERQPDRRDDAADQPPAHHPVGDRSGLGELAGAERAAGEGLGGDRDGVERERQERPDRRGQLVGGHRGGAEGRRPVGHHEQRGPQGQGPHHEGDPRVGGPADPGQVRAQRRSLPAGGADHDRQQPERRADLGQHAAGRRPRDAEVAGRRPAAR